MYSAPKIQLFLCEIQKEKAFVMNNPGGQSHNVVCYYSNKCRWSEGFIKSLKETPFKSEVKFICVDPDQNGNRPKLPGFLKKVPTLVVRGENEPRTDGAVMNWLSEKKLLAKNSNGAGGNSLIPDEPEPWVGGEMGGSLTKGFSFIRSDDKNEAPIGNFEFLNGGGAPGVRTSSDIGMRGGEGSQPKNKKQDLFDKQMQQYMSQRNTGMPQTVMRQ